ncbi:MAG: hypothetical protein ACH346_05060 [Chthoniobacterales bacterium]
MISDIVKNFCEEYGLRGLSIEDGGVLRLTIADVGDFQLVQTSGKLLTGLTRKIENFYLLSGRKILGACHFREPHFRPLHAQLKDDTLGIFYVFEESEITVAILSQSIESLTDAMDKIFQNL